MSKYSLNADTSKVLTDELLNHLLEQFPLGNSIIHGKGHWMRVLYNGRMLTKETGANLNVVELFAVMHDCQRDNEHYDLEHGRRAAKYVHEIRGKWFDIMELNLCLRGCVQSSLKEKMLLKKLIEGQLITSKINFCLFNCKTFLFIFSNFYN